jgi:hypothetical protein
MMRYQGCSDEKDMMSSQKPLKMVEETAVYTYILEKHKELKGRMWQRHLV